MEKFTMKTPDGLAANIAAMKKLFPEIVTEGKIDFEQLKTILGEDIAGDERYQFTWAGKRDAMLEASTPTTKTLRPCVEESKDWENTKNIYIEGDNLEALKILQNTYGGKVKMIYIDPPYNTGHDFIYHDNFHGTKQQELIKEGTVDAETGERFKVNSESNGHFHSDWCSMMYPRLKMARNLLREDGVIFISIDDNEVVNARKLCDEIFGEANFVAQIAWRRTDNQANIGSFAKVKEYAIVYAKSGKAILGRLPLSEKAKGEYRYSDAKGLFRRAILLHKTRGRRFYPKVTKLGNTLNGPWMVSEEEFDRMDAAGEIYWTENGDGQPYGKIYLSDSKGQIPNDFWGIEFGTNQRGSLEVEALFGKRAFDFPKPVYLVENMVRLGASDKSSPVLDFFSGSATTAHAVMKLNSEDGGNRKFILVQLPEVCAEGSEAAKAGYKNICEIGKERIRRAGEKIVDELAAKNAKAAKEQSSQSGKTDLFEEASLRSPRLRDSALKITPNIDIGFRVFKIDSSNMDDIYFQPLEVQQQDMIRMINNVKTDRNALDLLFGCLLEWGLPIDLPIKKRTDLGNDTYDVDGGRIIASFDSNVGEAAVKAIASEKPDFAMFRDLSFNNSATKINVGEIFKAISPNTQVKVL